MRTVYICPWLSYESLRDVINECFFMIGLIYEYVFHPVFTWSRVLVASHAIPMKFWAKQKNLIFFDNLYKHKFSLLLSSLEEEVFSLKNLFWRQLVKEWNTYICKSIYPFANCTLLFINYLSGQATYFFPGTLPDNRAPQKK